MLITWYRLRISLLCVSQTLSGMGSQTLSEMGFGCSRDRGCADGLSIVACVVDVMSRSQGDWRRKTNRKLGEEVDWERKKKIHQEVDWAWVYLRVR